MTPLCCYFHFLDYVLPKFNKVNLLFQKKNPTIHLLHQNITCLYGSLIDMFCNPNLVHKFALEDIDPCNESLYFPANQIFLGSTLHVMFQGEDLRERTHMVMDIKIRCRQFLITMCVEMKKKGSLLMTGYGSWLLI